MIDAGGFADFALKSLALAALVLLAERALRRRSAAERVALLHGGLLALALLPLLMAAGPRWTVPLPEGWSGGAASIAPAGAAGMPSVATTNVPSAPRGLPAGAVRIPAAAASDGAIAAAAWRIEPTVLLGLLYSLPLLVLLFALGLAVSGLAALRERAVPLRDARWANALRDAQRRAGLRGPVELLHSRDAVSPLSWGVRRRTIVLDADAIAPESADALLAHELAHLARHDWLWLLLGRAVTALHWFNPLAWWLARRCHQRREEAADDAVLRGAVAGVDYAELLLHFARRSVSAPAVAAHAIFAGREARSHLQHRLARVLDDGQRRAPALRGWSLACLTTAFAVALAVAALAPAAQPAHAAEPRVAGEAAEATTRSAARRAGAGTAAPDREAGPAAPRGRAAPVIASAGSALSFTLMPRRHAPDGSLQLTFEQRVGGRRSTHGQGVSPAALQGFAPAVLAATRPAPVAFRLVREAGTLDCRGTAHAGRATGECSFAPDAAFAAQLERRGVGRPDADAQLQLALQDAQLALLDELARQGYDVPELWRFLEFSIHGVDAAWLRGLQAAGARAESLGRLTEFRIHGVEGEWVAALRAAGYRDLSPGQLVEFRIHDVEPETVAALAAAGLEDIPARRLVELHIHGVTPDFVEGLAQQGYRDLDAERLVELRIHDVTPAFIREMAELGHRDVPVRDLLAFRIHGVTPAFVRELEALGYGGVAPRDLVAMRIHGVSPGWIRRQLADARGARPDVDALVERRIHGD